MNRQEVAESKQVLKMRGIFWDLFPLNFSNFVRWLLKHDQKHLYLRKEIGAHGVPHDFWQINSLPRIYTAIFRGTNGTHTNASGRNFIDPQKAVQTAFYEFIERSRSNTVYLKNKVTKTFNPQLLDGESRKIYDDFCAAGFAVHEFVKAQVVFNETSVYLPAQLFIASSVEKEMRRYELSSNGAAAGATQKKALEGALCELIERDHLTLFWLSRKKGVEITNLDHDIELNRIVQQFRRRSIEIKLYLLNHDFDIPVIVAVGLDARSGKPFAALGSSAGMNIKQVAIKAITESIFSFEQLHRQGPPSQDELQDKNTLNFHNRARYFVGERADLLWSAFAGSETISITKLRTQYRRFEVGNADSYTHILDCFSTKGPSFQPYYVTFKTPLLMKQIHVVKVYVPGLLPVYLFEKNRDTHIKTHPRLQSFGEYRLLREDPLPLA